MVRRGALRQIRDQLGGRCGDGHASAVIDGAGAKIPRVQVAADQHDLIWLFTTLQLADHRIACGARMGRWGERQVIRIGFPRRAMRSSCSASGTESAAAGILEVGRLAAPEKLGRYSVAPVWGSRRSSVAKERNR